MSRTTAGLVLGVLGIFAARPAHAVLTACTAAQISAQDGSCPTGTGPCTIAKDFTIGNNCILDFGTRAVTLKGGAIMTIGQGNVDIKAGSFTILGSGVIDGRGEGVAPADRGGSITIETTGAVDVQKATNAGRIDVSAITAAGSIDIIAGGNITISGKLAASFLSGNTAGGAGSISLDSGGDIVSGTASIIDASGGSSGISGSIDMRANGKIDLGTQVTMQSGDGGALSLDAGTTVILRGLQADATGDAGFGGELDIVAGGQVQVLAAVFARAATSFDGTSGGDGGTIDIESLFGDVIVSANLLTDGASPDGSGGSLSLTARGAIASTSGSLSARGGGSQSDGGDIALVSFLDISCAATLDASGGADGGSVDVASSGPVTLSGQVLAPGTDTASLGGDIRIEAGAQGYGALSVSGLVDASGGICDAFDFCGQGGLIDLIGCDVTVQSTSTILNRGGSGGLSTITAREQLRLNGPMDATKLTGPGIDGQNVFEYPTRKAPIVSGTVVPAVFTSPRATCTAANTPASCLEACPTCGNGVVEFPETCDTPGTPVSCDGCSVYCRTENCNDANPCTTDTCSPTLGCLNTAVTNGTPCSDGLVCNGVESCIAGFCFATPLNCNDNNPCTIDTCVEPGGCQHTNAALGASCSDGNACTIGDTCNGTGQCISGPLVNCSDNRECTTDMCNPATGCTFTNRTGTCTDDGNQCTADTCSGGNCVHPALTNGTPCNDNAFCTVNDACQSGVCLGGSARDCSDASACTTDTCDEATDTCVHTPIPVGNSCNDGNACTVGDACDAAGVCQPGVAANCDDGNPCTDDACDTSTGCTHTPHVGACPDDGNACTTDVCAGTACTHPAVTNGTTCSDGAFCTNGDSCQAGVCVPGPARDCSDGNSCTVDSCNEATDTCDHSAAPVGTACTDDDACTVGDACSSAGVCVPGPAANCDDGLECTTDGCNAATGCTHVNRTGACTDDGNACTTDVCAGSACTHPAVADNTACTDGQFCTVGDSCQGGVCQPGPARNCSDNNTCTSDICNEVTDACDHIAVPSGTPCSDGNACTVGDACDGAGACQSGAVDTCDDNNECTTDSCSPATGCAHVNRTGPCTDDGNACTTDVCSAGACTHPSRPNGTLCDDGAFCTVGDSCQSGTCVAGGARNCSDGNACTTDTCDELNDTCVQTPIVPCCGDGVTQAPEQCDDGNAVDTDACRNSCQLAVCGDGVVRTGVEDCDLGAGNSDAPDAACRTDCHPRRCGDGIVDAAAGEQCDDGNTTSGDGCSATCFPEMPATARRIPGRATSLSECLLEWAIDRPTLDKAGRPSFTQSCKDGDPSCDFGTTPGECTFHVWLCANNHEVLLPACNPGPGGAGTNVHIDVTKPSVKRLVKHPDEGPIRAQVVSAAIAAVTSAFDVCGPRLDVRVPLKSALVKGNKAIGVKGTGTSALTDTDSLKLVCTP